ncbi:MAG: hypothetical protein H8K04_08250 [Nitrospira sp.]
MFDLATIQSAISGLQTAGQLAKSMSELSASIDLKTKVIELQSAILAAQQSALAAQSDQLAMIERIRNLEKEIADVKAWEEQKQRYKMIPPWAGASCLVYGLKESCKGAEPAHWICTKCYDDGRRTVLNPKKSQTSMALLHCPTCKAEVETGYRHVAAPTYAQD